MRPHQTRFRRHAESGHPCSKTGQSTWRQHVWHPLFWRQPDNGFKNFLRNSSIYIPAYTTSHARELESSLCKSQSSSVLQTAIDTASFSVNIPKIIPQIKKAIQCRVITCTEQFRDFEKHDNTGRGYPKRTDQKDLFHQTLFESHKYTPEHTKKTAKSKYGSSHWWRQCMHKIWNCCKFCAWQEATLTTTQTLGRYANPDNRGSQNRVSTMFSHSVCSGKLKCFACYSNRCHGDLWREVERFLVPENITGTNAADANMETWQKHKLCSLWIRKTN